MRDGVAQTTRVICTQSRVRPDNFPQALGRVTTTGICSAARGTVVPPSLGRGVAGFVEE